MIDYPAKMVNQLLGASSNALVFDVLRLQHGYTYGAYSFFDCGKYANEFRATSSVQAAYTLEAMQLFKSCISTYGEQFTEQSLVKPKMRCSRKMLPLSKCPMPGWTCCRK